MAAVSCLHPLGHGSLSEKLKQILKIESPIMSNCFCDVLGTVIPRTSFGRKVTESEGERGVVSHPGVPKSTAVGGLRGSVRACPEGTGSRVQCIDGEKFATAASKSANWRGNSCMHSSACACA